eukprot:313772-Rhodomonas_salina.3
MSTMGPSPVPQGVRSAPTQSIADPDSKERHDHGYASANPHGPTAERERALCVCVMAGKSHVCVDASHGSEHCIGPTAMSETGIAKHA